MFRNDEERARARKMGITDLDRIYDMEELAQGDVMFAATGVTDGTMLRGRAAPAATGSSPNSIVMRSRTGTVRIIEAEHNLPVKAGRGAALPGLSVTRRPAPGQSAARVRPPRRAEPSIAPRSSPAAQGHDPVELAAGRCSSTAATPGLAGDGEAP